MFERSSQGNAGREAEGNGTPFGAPSISLPKGGGAIRGIGEKFAANPVTGTGSLSIPIATSPGRLGFGPQLSLSYDSGAGNGWFGFGWSLSLPSITRKTDKGLPRYRDAEESDVFILSGAEDLVPVLSKIGEHWERHSDDRTVNGLHYTVQRYRPRIEGLFARIERWTNQADPEDTFWRSISKDNITTWYGKTPESRIADPANPARIFSWLICESYDDKGNLIVYGYKEENSDDIGLSQVHERNRTNDTRKANRYLKRIRYGNHTPYLPQLSDTEPWPTPPGATAPDGSAHWLFEVVLDYGEHAADTPTPNDSDIWDLRNDPFSTYRSGFEVRTYRLCQRVLMFHHFPAEPEVGADCLVRSTDFTYSYEDNEPDPRDPIFSFLLSMTQTGYQRAPGGYVSKSLPPLEFDYTQPIVQEEIHEVDPESLENLPYGLDSGRYQWIDLDGEGLSGVLTEQADGWFYKRNLSPLQAEGEKTLAPRFGPIERVAERPSLAAIGSGRQQFLDLAGDGQLDLVQLEAPAPGFYERTHDERWESFAPFTSLPVLDWNNPNLKFVDLTGDGHADILISEHEVFCWHPSLAEAGFAPPETVRKALDEEKGPSLVFADGTQSIYLADLSGDGLTDLVRIRNGEVCYWPNLGYGRFGAKVTMDNAPWFDRPDLFDQRRIRLADIDGSGVTDIIYLSADGVRLYFNQSGNDWSPARTLTAFPHVDNLSSVQAADLLGNGTACLVWSSPLPGDTRRPMRYIDLMGGQKPHLLIKSLNNLGAETHVHYAPSTQFYLQDKQNGKPWITRLPFPVHCVERVETYDRVSGNRFVTRYVYHHGYFDGVEREFRGFGMVEQRDTEEIAALNADQQFPVGTNVEESSHVPPVLTRTWFHTGVHLDRDHISDFFAGRLDDKDIGEYYREPGLTGAQARQLLLDDTVLPAGLTVVEEREACRAMKGSMLRQEVYALDGTEQEGHPYTVTEQNFTIQRVQPKAGNHYAVFFTHARESISYDYERNPADPRIAHALTLEVDEFANVLKSAAVGYGRRLPDMTLSAQDRAKQAEIFITYTENGVTNAIEAADDYRTPLPCEARTFELTALTLPTDQSRFTLAEMLTAGTGAVPIAYEQSATSGVVQKRLIEHVRTLYRRNDLTGALPLGELQSLALPFESYRLAFSPGLAKQVYVDSGKLSQADLNSVLANDGKYVHSEGDANWWIASGRTFFSPASTDTSAQELAYTRQHFFLPHRYRDPFHTNAVSTESFVSYDAYDLLMLETRNALGNVVTVATKDDTGNTAIRIDYRVLQPYWVTDPNGNRTAVAFDALGMVVGTAVMGKPLPAPVEGDSLDGFEADLTEAVVLDHLANPLADPQTILQRATTRLVYDLFAYQRTKDQPDPQPAVVYTLARETHDSGPIPAGGLKIQHSFSYSDGFGREIQKKIQAEPGPVPTRDATGKIIVGPDGQPMMTPNDVSPRWVGSGWTVFNNKGKPVRQYEPFFTDTHRFELDVRIGVSPVLFYDPVERVIATLHPNHTWEKVVFDPWRQETWDVNDTVLVADPRTDPDAGDFFRRLPDADYLPTWHARRQGGAMGPQEQAVASKAAVHANTPTIAHADSLGRTFLTVAHDTFKYSDTPPADPPTEEFHSTRVVLDIEGNQREVIDVKDRVIMRYDYDMLGSRVHQASMEAGARWMLNDVAGKSLYAWDSRDHQFRAAYDQLRRPTDSFLREGPGAERVVGRSIYGESRPNPEASNLRGKVVQLFDQAGVVASDEYDFKGNLLRSQRQLAQEYKTTLDWSAAVPLEAAVFTSRTRYDALNRPTELTAPDDSIIRPAYNEANLLERMEANLRGALANGQPVWTPFVTDIDYDAKGQRTLIDYGNGVRTAYTYDPLTFRLVHLKTTRDPGLNGLASQIFEDPAIVQDLHYTYDPAGNIARIEDAVLKAITHDGEIIEPVCSYTYDALYRLIEAKGREHIGQTAFQAASPNGNFRDHPFVGAAQTNDLQALRNYTERYEYDAVGNFERLIHQAANGAWTRGYEYEEPSLIEPAKKSNRLSRTTVGQTTETYTYDGHGNMLHVPHLAEMTWDFEDQLQQVDLGGGGTAYYVYDEAGQRVRKVIERQNGTRQKERIHLGGYEVYREYGGNGDTVTLERETLHVMDDKERIALVETRTVGNDGSPAQLIRYQIGNHLGSASLELDETGQLISYEEYHPYGTTSYQAVRSGVEVSAKRYRYTGKERDEETGLYYHGARYYAGWLRRWVSCDPLSIHDSRNLYLYARANPIALLDRSGKSPDEFSEDDLSKKRAELDTEKRNYEIADKKLNSLIDQRVSAQRTFENAEKVFKKNPKLGGEAKKFIKSAKAAVKAFDEKIKQQGSEVSKLGDAVSKLEVSLEEGAEHLKELKDLEGEFNPSDKDFQKRLEGKPDVLDDDAAKKKLQDLQDQVDLEDAAKKLKEGSKKVLETPPKGGLRKLSKWVGRKLGSILPGGGAAASIMLAPEDESVIETGAHAVASEVGIGPFDLDLAWDIGTAVWEGAQRRAKWEFDETLRLEKEGKSYWEIAMRTQRGSKL